MTCDFECRWVSNSGLGGKPDFRPNSQMSWAPLMHVMCSVCGNRTWFTPPQWERRPHTSEEPSK